MYKGFQRKRKAGALYFFLCKKFRSLQRRRGIRISQKRAMFYNGEFLTNEQFNDKKFLKMVQSNFSICKKRTESFDESSKLSVLWQDCGRRDLNPEKWPWKYSKIKGFRIFNRKSDQKSDHLEKYVRKENLAHMLGHLNKSSIDRFTWLIEGLFMWFNKSLNSERIRHNGNTRKKHERT